MISLAAGSIFSLPTDLFPSQGTQLDSVFGIFVDPSGTLYIADQQARRILRQDPAGEFTSILGRTEGGKSGIQANVAALFRPTSIIVDGSNNLYISDTGNHLVRKVDASGIITTIAGNGKGEYAGYGGPATEASLNRPSGIFADDTGDLYIADEGSHRVRKVDTTANISTVAGSGDAAIGGFSGDGGPATDAILNQPADVFVDGSGNVYIADTSNHRVRKVDPSGIISTVAGSGDSPFGGFSGNEGPATDATLSYPRGVFVTDSGDINIADSVNNRIRRAPSPPWQKFPPATCLWTIRATSTSHSLVGWTESIHRGVC